MAHVLARRLVSMALLGTGACALRSHQAAREADPCTCKNWKQTYGSGSVRCGTSNEFFQMTSLHKLADWQVSAAQVDLGDQWCTHFFEAVDDNVCINVAMDNDMGQWCYVDAACSNLTGGGEVNAQLSWKSCSAERDRTLRSYRPDELQQFALAHGLEIGMTGKMSYRLAPYKWKYVSAFWDADLENITSVPSTLVGASPEGIRAYLKPRWGKRHRDIDEDMRSELQRIVDSGVPTVFDTAKDKHPPHVIVQGRSVYVAIPSERAAVVCVTGCRH